MEYSTPVKIDAGALDKLSAGFKNVDKNLKKALQRAVFRTGQRVKKEAEKSTVKVAGIKLSYIRQRVKLSFKAVTKYEGNSYAAIWIGLNPIPLTHMDPRKTAKGIRAGPINEQGAFMPGGKAGKNVFKRVGKQSLPIFQPTYDFSMPVMNEINQHLRPLIQRIWDEEFLKAVEGLFVDRSLASASRAKQHRV